MPVNSELTFKPAKNPHKLPKAGILAATKLDINALKMTMQGGVSSSPVAAGLTKVTVWPNFFIAGPVLGAPMAVMALEDLIRRGGKKFYFMGLAGSLSATLNIGDFFCPDKALSTEGTSSHYPAPLACNEDLAQQLNLNHRAERTIWSTDGIYRETLELVTNMKNKGAVAVDMETAALMAAANFRGVKFAALLTISDIITDDGHQQGLSSPAFKCGLAKTADILLKAVAAK